ncbi:MAG TPA: lipid IV(A) 3-deoxy-D-manno-octulosonic acid transferase [Steroidobacteraceae bacterium]|jgi:3-deoxy-D-manno-octulosonic-acid transferase|nr:lipid IV(A) 3-deoxy-D-manno-octulosonic acid transferase [Steroidobacteraceae bacterium]
MRLLYIVIAYLLAPVVLAAMALRGFRDRSHWEGFSQRLGLGAAIEGGRSIWVHAVSVGEVQAAVPLVNALLAKYPAVPLVVTTGTATGRARARALFGSRAHVRYVPVDLPGSVRRFFARVQPRLAVILETEIWPNLYHRCGQLGVPLVMASARISPRSVRSYRRLVGLFREALSHGIFIAAQSELDAERFRSIGASPQRTHVVGNIKFDFRLPPNIEAQGAALRRLLGMDRPVWVAGSTHAVEEDILLAAHRLVRARFAQALLVLVPRHPPRFAEVAESLRAHGVKFVTRDSGAPTNGDTEVFLVDRLGELLAFYSAADVAFVGGSLVPVGGHNLLEPAALGLPVLAGPNNFNSADLARLLVECNAVRIVHDTDSLAAAVCELLAEPAARTRMGASGRMAIEQNRGAVDRLMAFLEPLLP